MQIPSLPRSPKRAARIAEYLADNSWPKQGVIELLGRYAAINPTAEYVFWSRESSERLSIKDLCHKVQSLGSMFLHLGVQPQDRIVIHLPNRSEALVAYFAAAFSGAVAVPLLWTQGPEEGRELTNEMQPRVIIDLHPNRVSSVARLEMPVRVRIQSVTRGSEEIFTFDALVKRGGRRRGTPCDTALSAPHVVLFTSGSTSRPKGVVHSQGSLLAAAYSTSAFQTLGPEDGVLSFGSLAHISGLGLAGTLPIVANFRRVVWMAEWDPRAVFAMLMQEQLSFVVALGSSLGGLLKLAGTEGVHTPMKILNFAGSPAQPHLIRQAAERGWPIIRGYGLSEHGGGISMGRAVDPLSKRLNTDGSVKPGQEVALLSADGRIVTGAGPAEGEVLTRGTALFLGYFRSEDEEDCWHGDWFRTGDLGRLDRDGFLTIVGRIKEIVIRGGENISAAEVEETLSRHPTIVEAAVVGLPDERSGEILVAFVVVSQGVVPTSYDLLVHFRRSGMAGYKAPRRLIVVDELPRTATGKVRKDVLRARLGSP